MQTAMGPPAAVFARLIVLKKRSDFLAAAKARRQGTTGLHLQARRRDADEVDHDHWRVGFTCSKKVGNAVARNRAKRRLREIARMELTVHGKPGWDYVLVGRKDLTASLPLDQLRHELRHALTKVHT
ncbi:ribonuclease P protein component [Aestuariibius sp. HNIBRBA575]|uniref:ribonuclease P protein component n=1 Tax=Aestuariibius sp. HNIBRBA575 TaxID=3233343 RepID=UPI0034A4A1C8